ncbi:MULTISPECIES: multiple monosaccharide ABC transporter permease [Streptomyces]|uniref:Xylose transport system permease protein XylH n=2 Tax=Streptomyces TaxID=1883 RepID=A0ABT9KPF0_9ACTN|nr:MULTISPECIES: multiple monosaccharide ABC transporter permease [Streptomyces]MBW8091466.1 sugar ABC transporter permease [Streptomyces hygroscopicus subsp. hygroscopicus]MCO8304698.1 sugar ABC transporter permease [Streptomyces sp. RKCA744]MDN3057479.1 sugar ABC transporter permease [Streptomyces sp. SRF1]MDP9610316.1 putative multiple sugar transport system permease protein [Streptomyces demainii]GHJ28667.1 ABC transporter permease [Streptomyces hygroscopicus]
MSTATSKTESPAPPPAEGSPSVGSLLVQGLRSNMRQYGMLVALALIIVIFQIWSDNILLRPLNVTNLVQQNGYILILAIGMMIVIIAGHIDLSVGSLVAFIGAAAGVMMIKHDVPWGLAVVLCLLLGAVAGAWQGFWIAYIGIPSFIVTLAGMLAFRGGTQILLDGQSLSPFPDGFEKMSTGFIPEMGPYTQYHNPTMVIGLVVCAAAVWQEWRGRQQRAAYELDVVPLGLFFVKCAAIVAAVMAFTMTLSSWHGAPYGLLILAVLFVLFSFVMRNTVIGRHVYALGGNQPAAKLSGVRDKRVTFMVFVNMGVLAALAGLVFAARLGSATPSAGLNFELEAIAAAFIGGASASGGVGTVLGAIIGGLVLGVLNNGMSLVGIGTDYQQVIKGLVLLAAVGFDVWNKRKVGS